MKRIAGDFFEDDGGGLHHDVSVEEMVKEVNALLDSIRSYDVVAGVEVIWAEDIERMAERYENERC